jgi:DNA-binding phage protein
MRLDASRAKGRGDELKTHPILQAVFSEMKARGRSLESVSVDSGVSRSSIHRWAEWGNPKLLSLDAVAQALGLKIVVVKESSHD